MVSIAITIPAVYLERQRFVEFFSFNWIIGYCYGFRKHLPYFHLIFIADVVFSLWTGLANCNCPTYLNVFENF